MLADSFSSGMKNKPQLWQALCWVATVFLMVGVLGSADSVPGKGTITKSEWLVDVGWLHENLQSKDLILVDTRSQLEYLEGHIPGSIWLDRKSTRLNSSH